MTPLVTVDEAILRACPLTPHHPHRVTPRGRGGKRSPRAAADLRGSPDPCHVLAWRACHRASLRPPGGRMAIEGRGVDRERVHRTLTFWLRPAFALRAVNRFQR